jgi:hypothetical protein
MKDADLSKKQSSSLTEARINDELRALESTWSDKPGIIGWLSTTDHKRVGFRMVFTAFLLLYFRRNSSRANASAAVAAGQQFPRARYV